MKLLFILVAMVSIIPLAVWAGTGRRDRAWQALREYLVAMSWIIFPALVVVVIVLLPRLFG